MNNIYYLLLFIVFVVFAIIITFTDIKYGKVYNKSLIIFISISLVINVTGYILITDKLSLVSVLTKWMINLLIGSALSIIMYFYDMWAAGDAKLYIAVLVNLPILSFSSYTLNIFSGFYILVYTFITSFTYVSAETLVLYLRDMPANKELKIPNVSLKSIYNNKILIVRYVFSYIVSITYYGIIANFGEFYKSNLPFFMFMNFVIVFGIIKYINSIKTYFSLLFIGITYFIYSMYFLHKTLPIKIVNIKVILIVITVLLIRNFSSKYNYKEIEIDKLRVGDILAIPTVMLFSTSRVKGLPTYTTENTDSRLSSEEIDNIKRWSKSKKGQSTILVVRYLPFAPFIILGSLIYFLFKIL